MNTTRDLLKEFIISYRGYPCLWKVKCKTYQDRDKKDLAYEILRGILLREIPDCTLEQVKKKIQSIRSTHRKERKKVLKSKRSGAGVDDIYTPTLWYYPLLDFLDDTVDDESSVSNLDNEEDDSSTSILGELNDDDAGSSYTATAAASSTSAAASSASAAASSASAAASSASAAPAPPKDSKKRKRGDDQDDIQIMGEIRQMLTSIGQDNIKEDAFDHFGKYVAYELRNITDTSQQNFAQSLIMNAIMRGKCGTLDSNSKLTDPVMTSYPYASTYQDL